MACYTAASSHQEQKSYPGVLAYTRQQKEPGQPTCLFPPTCPQPLSENKGKPSSPIFSSVFSLLKWKGWQWYKFLKSNKSSKYL